MVRGSIVLVLAVLAVVVSGSPAGAQEPARIDAGVMAAGVDLSNLTVDEAAGRLNAELAPRLAGDLLLGAAGRPWVLTMAQAELELDALRTAKRALYAKAGTTAVDPAITHSRLAVKAFAEGVAVKVRRAARDASIRITVRRIQRKRGRHGRALDLPSTRAAIDAALDDPAAPRVLHQRLVKVRPKVNANDLRRVYATVLTIDRTNFKLRLFKGLRFRKAYGIAVGMAGLETPAGRYRIANKQVDPAWHVPNSPWAGSLQGQVIPGGAPDNPLKARWLGIANGVGIHGTSEDWSIGTRASHGCIRMHVGDVVDLFKRVPVGTAVLIR